jgi:hypothetical protein
MIRVQPPEEPQGYHEQVRTKGREWLEDPREGPTRCRKERPESYWTKWEECPQKLAEGFHHRCGYTASYTPIHAGHVDHFVSWAECKDRGQHGLVYEWNNLRWLNGRINQHKSRIDRRRGAEQLLDPFEVEDEWFELDLGRGVLEVVTDRVPPEKLPRVRYTLRELDLYDGRIVQEQRNDALEDYRAGTALERIEQKHPLVARAIRRLIDTPDEALTPANRETKRELLGARELSRSKP